MSSLQKTKSGYRIQFRLTDKLRQLSLPGAKKQAARKVQQHVDELISCAQYGSACEANTAEWLRTLDSKTLQKLIDLGLTPEVRPTSVPMLDLFDEFVKAKQNLAKSTYTNYMQCRRVLWACFQLKTLNTFTRGDADKFRSFCLHTMELGENTTRKRCGQLSTFWRWLVRTDLAIVNIFDDVPKAVGTAIDSKQFISAETISLVMEQAHSAEWRALIALGRWGGIRVPSEAFSLRWEDVNWEINRVTINSSKTAHQNKPQRTLPLFPELVVPLTELWESAKNGDEWVLPTIRFKSQNVRTPFHKIIKRAGFEPWPNLWKSLRSTRETELAAVYPIHVVCEWMGNTAAVARRHYLKATEADFTMAICTPDTKTEIAPTMRRH